MLEIAGGIILAVVVLGIVEAMIASSNEKYQERARIQSMTEWAVSDAAAKQRAEDQAKWTAGHVERNRAARAAKAARRAQHNENLNN